MIKDRSQPKPSNHGRRKNERAHVGPVCHVIGASAELPELPAEHEQKTLRVTTVETFYCIVGKVEELLVHGRPSSISIRKRVRAIYRLTLNRLALVPIMNPVWSN